MRGAPRMFSDYMFKLDLVVTFVSLVTIIVLWILKLTIPQVLIWTFVVSLVLLFFTLFMQKYYDANERN